MGRTENFWLPGLSFSNGFPIVKNVKAPFVNSVLLLRDKLEKTHENRGVFVRFPLLKWKYSKEIFDRHSECEYHKSAAQKNKNFKLVHDTQSPVDVQVATQAAEEGEANRRKIIGIIDTVITCARQNIPLRRHRELEKNETPLLFPVHIMKGIF